MTTGKHFYRAAPKKKKRPGELAPKEAEISLSHLQFAILVANFLLAVKSSDIGYENTKKTLAEFSDDLERKIRKIKISVEDLEDLLCAVNQRAEAGSFWSPTGETFDEYLRKLFWYSRLDGEQLMLDRDYNTISYAVALEPEDLKNG